MKWDEDDKIVSRRGYSPEKSRRDGSEGTGRIKRSYGKERIQLCRQWWRWGECKWNNQCRYAHGSHELGQRWLKKRIRRLCLRKLGEITMEWRTDKRNTMEIPYPCPGDPAGRKEGIWIPTTKEGWIMANEEERTLIKSEIWSGATIETYSIEKKMMGEEIMKR